MKKIYLYPFWLRFWHWSNALLFLILIVSGLSLHYSDPNNSFIPFQVGVVAHNLAGILLSLNYLFFVIKSIISGNIKHYIPNFKGLTKRLFIQARYYLLGIFIGEPHPFKTDPENKFNPMQQLAYLGVMFFLVPLVIISGWALLFPEFAPDKIFGMGGVWPMALLHTIVGFLLSVFMFAHIYLATTGNTVGELFKSMISGWHLEHEVDPVFEAKIKDKLEGKEQNKEKKRLLPIIFYNPITLAGTLLSLISFTLIAFLTLVELFAETSNPYLGIVTFLLLPTFLILGLLLIAFGAIKENRRLLLMSDKKNTLPIINLNNPKHQIALFVFTVGTFIIIIFSVFGSFKAYEYTDSDQFCGEVCHKVMEPEYTAYKDSPHSRVGCVKCHIGPGADWFVKSKISGSYQVYSIIFNKYSRPIKTPIPELRPAQETCEQCHLPSHFYNEKKVKYDLFLTDEKNSEYQLTMLVKVGGGTPEFGNTEGIHWHMNLANDIYYISTDESRNNIPWVKSRNKKTGKEVVYRDTSQNIPTELIKPTNYKKMDCIDCHNRPSHVFNNPNKVLNVFMQNGRIDKTIPYIKNVGVQSLETYARSRKTALKDIENFVWNFYKTNYPEIAQEKEQEINNAINHFTNIYLRNYFPDMKVNWKVYPSNIGHMHAPGCYRCHDGKHVSKEGNVISNDCNICHTIIYQKIPGQEPQVSDKGLDFIHPGGVDKIANTKDCVRCHGVKAKQSQETIQLSQLIQSFKIK